MAKALQGTAIYSGGGIYIYCGRLDNGNYITSDSENNWVAEFNADTYENFVESDYCEWKEEHLVRYWGEEESAEFLKNDFLPKLINDKDNFVGEWDFNALISELETELFFLEKGI